MSRSSRLSGLSGWPCCWRRSLQAAAVEQLDDEAAAEAAVFDEAALEVGIDHQVDPPHQVEQLLVGQGSSA